MNEAARRPRVVMIVLNEVTSDSRVKKTAATVARTGAEVIVLGYSPDAERVETRIGDVRIIRLPNPFVLRGARNARRDRRLYRSRRPARIRRHVPRPGYRNRAEVIEATHRRRITEREVATRLAALRVRLRGLEGEDSVFARAMRVGLIAVVHLERRRLEVIRRVAKLRRALYARRVHARDGQPHRTWEPVGLRLDRIREQRPEAASWRRLLPELQDFELAMGPVIDELRPDVIHAHDFLTVGIAARAATRARGAGRDCRWIYDAHEYVRGVPHHSRRKLQAYANLESEYIRSADRIITVSPRLSERLEEDHDLDRMPTVVLNAPPAQRTPSRAVPAVRDEAGVGPDVPLLVYSGGVTKQRMVDTLVSALPLLPDVHCALVVKSELLAPVRALVTLAEELGCDDRLHLVPFVDPDEVPDYLRSATVGVHTLSHCDNHELALPNKYFEYLHAGLPMVVSDVRAMARLTTELGVGEVFVAGDPETLAIAARKVIADRDAYAANIRADLLTRYSWETQALGIGEIYAELLGDRITVHDRIGELGPLTEEGDAPSAEAAVDVGPEGESQVREPAEDEEAEELEAPVAAPAQDAEVDLEPPPDLATSSDAVTDADDRRV